MKWILYFIFLILSFNVKANFSISPLNQEVIPGKQAISYVLENKSNERAAYSVIAKERQIDKNGKDILLDTKDIRVFPSKVILNPGQQKRIKALYLGSKAISVEKSYKVIFEQDDIKVKEGFTGAVFKYKFLTALYISPKDSEGKLKVDFNNKENQVSINNEGTKHIILTKWGVVFNQGTDSEVIYKESLPDVNMLAKSNIVLPIKPGVAPSKVNSIDILEFE